MNVRFFDTRHYKIYLIALAVSNIMTGMIFELRLHDARYAVSENSMLHP